MNRVKSWLFVCSLAGLFLSLTACMQSVQTTSGREYLSRYPTQGEMNKSPELRNIDQEVTQVAAVEPLLRFPARIGLAKIEAGDLAPLSQAEADLWFAAVERLGADFGEFVPVSRLIAAMLLPSPSAQQHQSHSLTEIIRKIRLTAARQHLDAVLLYEVYGKSERNSNLLSLLDLTIIGAYLSPGQSLKAEGYAKALLLDVRNGYPYGTADGIATQEGLSTRVGASGRQTDLYLDTVLEATRSLVQESEKMFLELRRRL